MSIQVCIKTNKGDINLDLFPDKAPITVSNFINLALRTYYNGSLFHRVIPEFMVQTGSPNSSGSGSPGYEFVDECSLELLHDKPGVLSMAKPNRPNSNGSQFFITHVPTPWLDGIHTVFGEVKNIEQMQIVNSIQQGDNIIEMTVTGDIQGTLSANKEMVKKWNGILDKNFPKLPNSQH